MLRRARLRSHAESYAANEIPKGSISLQIVLWLVWTAAIGLTAAMHWQHDRALHQALDVLGLTIHCVLAGTIGLIVLTKLEMWLEPWRFFD